MNYVYDIMRSTQQGDDIGFNLIGATFNIIYKIAVNYFLLVTFLT